MKLYRLDLKGRQKLVGIIDSDVLSSSKTLTDWEFCLPLTTSYIENHLEEVESRIELELVDMRNDDTSIPPALLPCTSSIHKKSGADFTEEECVGMEAFCNGELYTMDQSLFLHDKWISTNTELSLTDWIKQRKA